MMPVSPLKKPYHKKIYFGVTSGSPWDPWLIYGFRALQIRSHARQYLLPRSSRRFWAETRNLQSAATFRRGSPNLTDAEPGESFARP
jgi:hypothetical protein